jgi:hypothetical protein
MDSVSRKPFPTSWFKYNTNAPAREGKKEDGGNREAMDSLLFFRQEANETTSWKLEEQHGFLPH